MKHITIRLLPILFLGTLFPHAQVQASGVEAQLVPSDVEWLLHLDAESLRQSRVGEALLEQVRASGILHPVPEIPVDPTALLNGLQGLTAYGSLPDPASAEIPDDGVVILQGTTELLQVVRGAVAGWQLEKPDMLVTRQVGDQTVYQLAGQTISGAFIGETHLVIGKSGEALASYLQMAAGKRPHLKLRERFPSFKAGLGTGFFLGVVVEGMQGFGNLPAQARILQMARAVSIQFGELAESLKLEASLQTSDTQTATQVRDILQGILALMSLQQVDQPELAAVLRSARVSMADKTTSVEIAYPVEASMVWIDKLSGMIAAMQAEKAAGAEGSPPGEGAESTGTENPGQ